MKKMAMCIIVAFAILAVCGYSIGESSAETTQTLEDRFIADLHERFGDNIQFVIYDTDDLTLEVLEHRTERDELIVERCVGVVTNAVRQGDGRIINTAEDYYNYISYSCVGFEVNDGTIVLSYMVFNPDTDYEDDIIERFDYAVTR